MEDQVPAKKKLSVSILLAILKNTVQGFMDDNVPRLAASLAYATLFSIIPFLSLLVTIGTFFQVDIGNELYTQLQPVLGAEVVNQLRDIMKNAEQTNASTLAGIVALCVTIFGATAIFAEIQDSLNTIWGIKAVPKKSWLKYIKTRLLSFSVILVFAFILLITFTVTNVISNLSAKIMSNYPAIAESIVRVIGMGVNFGVTTSIFVLLYKVLPDAEIKSKDVWVGAVITTLLFLVGQWGISLYIGIAHVGSVYGVAAFMAILITWIYYSAIIIYIGAEFTESWANKLGSRIVPDDFAVATKTIEVHEQRPLGAAKKERVEK